MKANSVQKDILSILQDKGVRICCPESVEVGPDLEPSRISGDGVTIHAGCKLYGAKTLIMPGVELGYEAPVTVHNCQLGRNVKLKGGFFQDSCFLDGANMGSGAQIREACLLEEQSRGAHTVGLKHTILFPFVTLGSVINFCDCLMAGGTGEKNHSEVGSSYIHFNYTPNQDKATPSLIGDVPKGVMINQPPIFLGGQGGLVGPVTIGYGAVVAAGTIVRKDLLKKETILLGHPSISRSMTFRQGLYTNIKRIISQNTLYISNLIALRRWYLDVRFMFIKEDPMERGLLQGASEKLDKAIDERVKRLGEVAGRMPQSIELYQTISSSRASKDLIKKKKEFSEKWPEMEQTFREAMDLQGDPGRKAAFLSVIEKAIHDNERDYLAVIRGLKEKNIRNGTQWLQGLVDEISAGIWEILPSFRKEGRD
jgi:bifunctional UDP-N-acetylglucosamine pyrophosphorylase/glucosamine-1-phosphate N-acetyltransferase